MQVTKLLQSESTTSEFVFETSPLLTDQILEIFNQRTPDKAAHYKQRDGKLVITAAQMADLKAGRWSKEPAKVFSEILTEIESELAAQATASEQSKRMGVTQMAKWFGVPVE